MASRCLGTTQQGNQCGHAPAQGQKLCSQHVLQTCKCVICHNPIDSTKHISCHRHLVEISRYHQWLAIILRNGNTSDRVHEILSCASREFIDGLLGGKQFTDDSSDVASMASVIDDDERICVICRMGPPSSDSCTCKDCKKGKGTLTEFKLRRCCVMDMIDARESRTSKTQVSSALLSRVRDLDSAPLPARAGGFSHFGQAPTGPSTQVGGFKHLSQPIQTATVSPRRVDPEPHATAPSQVSTLVSDHTQVRAALPESHGANGAKSRAEAMKRAVIRKTAGFTYLRPGVKELNAPKTSSPTTLSTQAFVENQTSSRELRKSVSPPATRAKTERRAGDSVFKSPPKQRAGDSVFKSVPSAKPEEKRLSETGSDVWGSGRASPARNGSARVNPITRPGPGLVRPADPVVRNPGKEKGNLAPWISGNPSPTIWTSEKPGHPNVNRQSVITGW